MNKQQLIDKAIDYFNGVWPEGCRSLESSFGLSYTREEFEARKAEREALTSGVEIVNQALKELGLEKTIINKQWQIDAIESKIEEIKSREWVDELIVTTNHWFDYEHQKALRLPPVGEIVQMVTNIDEVRIVAHDSGFAVYWYELLAEYQHTDAYELFRPLDWDANKIQTERSAEDYNKVTKVILDAGSADNRKQHWFDYKNQKALRFPPVGETCLVNEYDKVEIVGETKDGYKVYKYIDTGFLGMACQITSYKPIDWDGGLKSIIIKSCDITDYDASILTATLLAAGYRKCDNNDPTTQE